jgi:hypothetical protein
MKTVLKIVLFCALTMLLFTAPGFSQELHPAEKAKQARTISTEFKTSINFYNQSGQTVKLFWLDQSGNRAFVISLKAGESTTATTYLSQPWVITDESENALAIYYPDAQPREIKITGTAESSKTEISNRSPNPPQTVATNRPPRRGEDDEDDYNYRDSRAVYDEKPITICRDQQIPRGYVITKTGSDFNCPNWNAVNNNTYTIRRPSRTETTVMCSVQEIPRGYVIVGAQSNFGCPNWNAVSNNSYVIRRPRDTEKICSVSDVPRRYAVTREFADFGCPNWNAVGTNAKEIKRVN